MRGFWVFGFLAVLALFIEGCGGGSAIANTEKPVTRARVYPDSAALFFSPYNWVQTGVGDAASALTPNTGAYIKFNAVVSAKGRGTVTMLCDPSIMDGLGVSPENCPLLKVFVDKVVTQNALRLTPGVTEYELAHELLPGSHEVEVVFRGAPNAAVPNRWEDSKPLYAWKITGFELTGNVQLAAAALRPNRLLAYGSSSFEGAEAVSAGSAPANMDATLTFAWKMAQADKLNAEVGIVGWSGQGYVTGALGSVPSFYAGKTWANITRNNVRSFTPVPDYILLRLGKNDSADYSRSLYDGAGHGWLVDIRSACPNASIFITSPYYNGEGTPNQINYTANPIKQYQASNPGTRLAFLELAPASVAMNGRHPSSEGHTALANHLWGIVQPYLAEAMSPEIKPIDLLPTSSTAH